MAQQKYPLDRSAAFTALLELDPGGFGKQDAETSSRTITEFLEDWYAADSTNMWEYAGQWLARQQEAAQRAPDAPEQEAPVQWFDHPSMKLPDEPRSLEEQATGGDWQVTAQVHREADGWQSSRQVPAFTVPRWEAPTRADAEAKAREIMNPYEEPYEITMDVWAQDGPQAEGDAEPPADASRLDPPRSMQACWDEAAPGPGPTERQLEDWAEHNALADGLDLEAERGE